MSQLGIVTPCLSEPALGHAAEADGEQVPGSVVLTFNPAHPEGSHTLRLAVPAERSIAVLMCNLDQASTFDLIRNIRLDGKALGGTVKKLRWPTRWVKVRLLTEAGCCQGACASPDLF